MRKMNLLPPLEWVLRARGSAFVVHWETVALPCPGEVLAPEELASVRRVGAFSGSLWQAWCWSRAFSRRFTIGRVQIWPEAAPDRRITAAGRIASQAEH